MYKNFKKQKFLTHELRYYGSPVVCFKRAYGEGPGGSNQEQFGKKWYSFSFDWKAISKTGKDLVYDNAKEFTKTAKTGVGNHLGKMVTNPSNIIKAGGAMAGGAYLMSQTQSQSDNDKNHKEVMRQMDDLRSGQEQLFKSQGTLKKNLGDFQSNIDSLTKENERLTQENERLKQEAREFLQKNQTIIMPKPNNGQ